MQTRFLRCLLAAAIVIFCSVVIGCGGGSKGTGAVDFVGRAVTLSGTGVSGAQITITSTGDSGTTDADGNFNISSAVEAGDVELLVDTDNFSATTVIPNVPGTAKVVRVTLEVDEENEEVSNRDVQVEEHERSESGSESDGNKSDSGSKESKDSPSGDRKGTDSKDEGNRTPTPRPAVTPPEVGEATPTAVPRITPTPTPSHHESEHEGEDAEGEGRITALSSSSLTVDGIAFRLSGATRYYDLHEHSTSIASFAVGTRVHVNGTWHSGIADAETVRMTD
ncbi:MAG: hypothetical protein K1X83_10860 [Oligoflexia bacterium]|nr:hypothetical protein [Oligoflexia bacterium]